MTQAIIYSRVSTDEQAESGAGLNAQVDACRAFVQQQGWGLAGQFADEGVSGTADLDKRTGLMAAMGELKKGEVLLVLATCNRKRLNLQSTPFSDQN